MGDTLLIHRYRLCLPLLVLLVSSWPQSHAQRAVVKIDAQVLNEELVFDTNEVPISALGTQDLNFAPNLVFSPDSTRVFVSFPASNKVGVFAVPGGDLLKILEVGANPTRLTATPDGRTIAVPCVHLHDNLPQPNNFRGKRIGTISLIDTESLEVRNINLTETFFSMMNNVVFASDGSTGFIASAGTDEIIRFNVAHAAETGRLAMDPATVPVQLTMSPDGSFFAAVLVGSSGLPFLEVPDSIVFIDTNTFTVRKRLSYRPDDDFPYDFVATNNLVFSEDGRLALIADRGRARLAGDGLEAFVGDRALLIDAETGEIERVFILDSGVASSSVLTPDGRFFVVLTAWNICFIRIDSQEIHCIEPTYSDFLPTTVPAFGDGGVLYIPSPLNDLLGVVDTKSGVMVNRVEIGGPVERDQDESFVALPSAPISVGVSPDQNTIVTVNFNANVLEFLEHTERFTIPQLVADDVGRIESPGDVQPPIVIPAGDRFYSGVAISNFGEGNADLVIAAHGTLIDPAASTPFDNLLLIGADPNPIQVCDGSGLGATEVSWDVTSLETEENPIDEVEVRVGSVSGAVLATGGTTGSAETGAWVADGMVFVLLNRQAGEVLDYLVVTHTRIGCPAPTIRLSPNPIQVCDGELGQTTVNWDAEGIAERSEIRIGSPTGPAFAGGTALSGSQSTGRWVSDGMVFVLVDATNDRELARETAEHTRRNCLGSVRLNLRPGEQAALTSEVFQPEANRKLDGWLDVDSDSPSLAGMFLAFDGEVNRLDGGAMFQRPVQSAVIPEVRIHDGFSTYIEVVKPDYDRQGTLRFDLFDSEGALVATATRQIFTRSRLNISVAGDPDDPTVRPLFDAYPVPEPRLFLIDASPNPISMCDGGQLGATTISWDVRGALLDGSEISEVRIHVDAADGQLFAEGGPTGSSETGRWVRDGTAFYLVDGESGTVLDKVTVRLTRLGCPFPAIVASPNPIPVCDGGQYGVANISWDTAGESWAEIRVDSPTGTVFATGGPTGSRSTGSWVNDGMTFYLLNADTEAVLDTVRVTLTQAGCPLLDFADGHIRVTSPSSFVAIARYFDEKGLAVLSAQPVETSSNRLFAPHFVAFGGAETVLKLVYPVPTAPTGVFRPETDEAQEDGVPITASVALKADDGALMAAPVTVVLDVGQSLRQSVADMFDLPKDLGSLSGWIEVVGDRPGLVGSVMISVFNREGLTAFPLQDTGGTTIRHPHVAQGLGYSTGLALVNPGPEVARLRVELRRQDATLVGELDPLTLRPGQRVIGLVDELFPAGGELLGGSIRIVSDRPVGSLMLFYTNNLRVLSAVPGQRE